MPSAGARIDDPRVARIVEGALGACDPRVATRRALARRALRGPISILAFGKCAAPMMRGALEAVSPDEALVVTLPGEHTDLVARGVRVHVGSHPEPSADAPRHGEEALALAARATGTLLVLISGGGSALLEVPAPGVSIGAIADVARQLMHRGAPIAELNLVRAALSSIKGGRLAAATRAAEVLTLVVEDVPGHPELVASGPTMAPPRGSAIDVLARHGVALDAAMERAIARAPTPWRPGEIEAIVTNDDARRGALAALRALGLEADDLGATLTGEARETGAALARELARRGRGMIVGGETTVTVTGDGRGGRNQELVLGAYLRAYLEGEAGLVLSLGTDGVDGASDHAGAYLTPAQWRRAKALGLDARAALARNDSAPFFETLGTAIRTGPTGVNVADLVCLLPIAAISTGAA